MRAWLYGAGGRSMESVGKIMTSIEKDASDADMVQLGTDCTQMSKDVRVAQDNPMPDVKIQAHWGAGLRDAQQGAYYCIEALNKDSAADATQMGQELNAFSGQVRIALEMMTALKL
jgi:hypothetical protein